MFAELLNEKGEKTEAERILQQILPLQREKYGAAHFMTSVTLLELGKAALARGENAQAEPILREAFENLRSENIQDKWFAAEAESVLGECLLSLGRRDEAKPLLEEGVRLLGEELGDERKWIIERARKRLDKLR